ncbi:MULTISPECIES: arsenite efflux transporter metallochaperone ArsD [Pelosinus]|uniref:Arsenical resistance operon trans-acting repressor ArsD n=1 Tax=Pelosinus fermentans B4 TaxID=1149862 RepID=I8RDV3_9FIRM|nr:MULTISPECIES: arsenite efflux transporter metallochaperone ArsD [Pelosinus]EIW15655.1 Arsenical resistance operon trans-acting repressor ArsD [Pelosinus fermentans B4]EIW26655.1 Arsenical resistance operon trans-acting repressor ArsD [Pelosinus fermentans A11]OAM92400.1 Arsenical resistance operon trans-acting repressor ArsD [Pelosinus fermentans DSM 17108]SDQ43579.1 Arsenical resistance operon trans-acting repressor ArsD [Pelosinus fermentans]
MSKIEIFDPAMCCATGICGPGIDQELLRVATTINTLTKKGITVIRYGLSAEPQAFIDHKKVNEYLMKEEVEVLPITVVDGEVVKTREYPTQAEFAKWAGLPIEELASIVLEKQQGCCCDEGGCC